MRKEKTLEERKTEASLNYKAGLIKFFDAIIKAGEEMWHSLRNTRNDPKFTKVFSPEEIIVINQFERKIPKAVAEIIKSKQSIERADPANLSDPQIKELVDFAKVWNQKTFNLFFLISSRMPQKTQLFQFIEDPVGYSAGLIKLHKIKQKIKKKEKILAEKEKKKTKGDRK